MCVNLKIVQGRCAISRLHTHAEMLAFADVHHKMAVISNGFVTFISDLIKDMRDLDLV